MEKILLIYNPNSGKKNIAAHIDKITEIFSAEEKLVTLYRIGDKNNLPLSGLIQDGGFDGIVVCGGDGSVNSIAKIMLDSKADIPLGVIPNGTCNDFSRSLGMPGDIIRCARLIAQGNVTQTDIGYINGKEAIFTKVVGGDITSKVK